MAKKVINIFFLLVFTTQLIPVKQVGRILFQATMVEELPEKTPSKSSAGFEDDYKHFTSLQVYSNPFNYNNQSLYIHFSETLPGLMAGDVHSPPPDFS
jgi:hypothetical protein